MRITLSFVLAASLLSTSVNTEASCSRRDFAEPGYSANRESGYLRWGRGVFKQALDRRKFL